MPVEDVRKCITVLLAGQRADGCVPDRVQVDGLAVYSAGPVEHPLGAPPTDNSQFLINLAYKYICKTGDLLFAKKAIPQLTKALDYIPVSDHGLVMISQHKKQSPYGFTDTIAKTGELLFSSLLYWQACKEMAELCMLCGINPDEYHSRSDSIVENLDVLWDPASGAYLAATEQCNQVDVWGNAYAVYCGLLDDDKMPQGRKFAVLEFLHSQYSNYVSRGQVRHLLAGTFWGQTLMPVTPETYQNGAYWATASGWVMSAIWQVDKLLAVRMLQDLVIDFHTNGVFECINGEYTKLNHYVVSAVNPLGAVKLFYT